ncbi:MAG: hypothetical protein GY722_21705 [bacterium]|nr:hypothetical protein [bacterium]
MPDSNPASDNWKPLGELEEPTVAQIYSTGTFSARAISPANGAQVALSVSWQKFNSRQEFEHFTAKAGLHQNSVSLTLTPESVFSPEDCPLLIGTLVAVGELLSVNYMFAVDFRGCDFDYRFDTASGLGIGLKDVYLVNIFGAALVSLIGSDTLLQLPAEVVEEDRNSILVAPLRDFVTYDLTYFEKKRAMVRDAIGAQFFSGQMTAPASGAGCIFTLPYVLWKESRRFRNERGGAESTPVFDWSGMWEREP